MTTVEAEQVELLGPGETRRLILLPCGRDHVDELELRLGNFRVFEKANPGAPVRTMRYNPRLRRWIA